MKKKSTHGGEAASPGAPGSISDPVNAVLLNLKQRYPGRESQIDTLADRLRASRSFSSLLFIYGPPSSAKTAVVRDLLTDLGMGHAYISCFESTRTRSVLESILHQLRGGKRRRDDGYSATTRCDSLTEFMNMLPAVVARHNSMCWVVLDAAHRLASTDLLTALTRAPDLTGAPVGVIVISTLPWGSGRFSRDIQNVQPPTQIHFPGYTQDQLVKILTKLSPVLDPHPFAVAYRQFLAAVVPAFSRATTNVLDLCAALARLWPIYSAPLKEGRPLQGPALLARIRADMQHMISELDMGAGGVAPGGASGPGPSTAAAEATGAAGGPAAVDRRASAAGLAFELPYMSKFLLLAAYIASRNKPTADRAVFDPGFSRKGRRNAQALDRQAEAAVEATLKGPHSFPLERLLHIFYCVYEQHGPEGEEGGVGEEGRGGSGVRHEVQRAEVQMQLSTLVALRLLSASSSDMLEGGMYRCNLADDVALAIAANVKLRLGDYLKLA